MYKSFFWCGRPQVKGNQALAFELPERSGHEHQQSGNAASFLAENEKKTITLSSFLLVRSMGLAPQPYGRRRFCAFFCAANAVAITPGTKNSAPCCFLNVPFKSHTFLQKK